MVWRGLTSYCTTHQSMAYWSRAHGCRGGSPERRGRRKAIQREKKNAKQLTSQNIVSKFVQCQILTMRHELTRDYTIQDAPGNLAIDCPQELQKLRNQDLCSPIPCNKTGVYNNLHLQFPGCILLYPASVCP
jgi:hypothetical protein